MDDPGDEGSGRRGGRRRNPKPLDEAKLRELALAYVARFATSRGKLVDYLGRKLRERGWSGEERPDLAAIADRLSAQGFVDDRSFAESKTSSLLGRGYGAGRVRQALSAARIEEDDRTPALELAASEARTAALRFAERRRIGPFSSIVADQAGRQKALAAMLRAGHSLDLARQIVAAPPGSRIDDD